MLTKPIRDSGNPTWIRFASAAMLVLVGVLAYSNTANVPFVFDDSIRIIYNKKIRTLWPTVAMSESNRPIVNYTFAINQAIHGDEVWGYHALNLAIHLTAGLLLYGIVRRSLSNAIPFAVADDRSKVAVRSENVAKSGNDPRFFRGAKGDNGNRERYSESLLEHSEYLALAIALIWVAHPLQTQAVTYINQRYESLMGLFYLLTLYSFIRSIDSKYSKSWRLASVAMCAIGMGCKEAMVSAPLIVLWYDRAFVETSWRTLFAKRKLYYTALASTWAILAWAMLHYTDEYTTGGMVVVAHVTPWTYLLSQSDVLVHYLRLAIWPQGQCFFDEWPVAHSIQEVLPQALCILTILFGTVWSIFRFPMLGFLGGWFFLILAPTSSFIPIRDLIFEYRMYLPLAAVTVTVVLGTFALACRCGRFNTIARMIHAVLMFAVVICLAMTTYARNSVYRSEISLWQDTVMKAPHHADAWHNIGLSLINAGRSSEALPFLAQASKLAPNDADTNSSFGAALVECGEYELAKVHLDLAIQSNPKDHVAMRNMGNLLLDTGKGKEAIEYCERAIQLAPPDPELNMSLVAALIVAGRFEDAIDQCNTVLKLQPTYTKAHLNLLSAYSHLGRYDEAIEHGFAAVDAEPNTASTHGTLGMLLVQSDRNKAIEHLRIACALDSANTEYHLLLGKLLAKDRPQEAIPCYEAILTADPNNIEMRYKLASLHVACGEIDMAIKQIEAIVSLRPESQEARNYLQKLRNASDKKNARE